MCVDPTQRTGGMNYSWYIGQKVVCVDASNIPHGVSLLMEGATYVLSKVVVCNCPHPSLGVGMPCGPGVSESCRLCSYAPGRLTDEWGYRANRFRPLDALTETMERIEKEGCPIEQEPQLI